MTEQELPKPKRLPIAGEQQPEKPTRLQKPPSEGFIERITDGGFEIVSRASDKKKPKDKADEQEV